MRHLTSCAVTVLSAAFLSSLSGQPATSWTITSPDSLVKATVQLTDMGGQANYPAGDSRLYYTVWAGGPHAFREVVKASPMGLVRSDRNFTSGLTYVSESALRTIDSSYTMLTGKRSRCRNSFNEKTVTFQTAVGGSKLEIIIRTYNDGFAFRYRFPENDPSKLSISSETTGFRPPANSVLWMLPYNTPSSYTPAYEDRWLRNLAVGASTSAGAVQASDNTWCMPALFKTPDNYWALIWESDVNPAYCNSRLSCKDNPQVYQVTFPNEGEAGGLSASGPAIPSSTLPWTMPWRVVITGTTPGTILESTLSTDLAATSVISDVSWIKPGRSSWSWWSSDYSPKDFNALTPFVDLSASMQWEYFLVDANWPDMQNGTWRDLANYAKAKNVGLSLWYNSGGSNNDVTEQPRNVISDPAKRAAEFAAISSAGIKGVKIDFWGSDKQGMVAYYFDVFKDAAEHKLLVNLHGSTIPRGWQRTYPNLMSSEAVRGGEIYKFDARDIPIIPWMNTILPFTRNAVASMDWTPVIFTVAFSGQPRLTTSAHELATSVIMESGIQHFADAVIKYSTQTISAGARDFLKAVPVAWDDTRYIAGYPGSYIVLARRKGQEWYCAGIAGDTARKVTARLSFLNRDTVYNLTFIGDGSAAGTFSEKSAIVTSADSLLCDMAPQGGFVARFTARGPASAGYGFAAQKAQTSRITRAFIPITRGTSLRLSGAGAAGNNATISVYSLNGVLIRRVTVESGTISAARDLHLSSGLYFVQIK